jgi:hypothetical protein
MKIKAYYYLSIGILALLCSCEQGENELESNHENELESNQEKPIFSMDIVSAKALAIKSGAAQTNTAQSAPQMKSAGSTNKLYQVTQEGYLLEVTYKDEDGNPIQSEQYMPVGVYNTPSNFVIIEYETPHQYLIVNTSTGAAHVLWSHKGNGKFYLGPWNMDREHEEVPFEIDNNGNLYMIICSNYDGKGSLYKLNVADMTLERLTPDLYNVTSFLIDEAGNVLFGIGSGSPRIGSMFRFANGNFYDYEKGEIIASWNGQGRKIFAMCEVPVDYPGGWSAKERMIVRFDIDQDTVVPVKIEDEGFAITNPLYGALSQRYKTGNYPYKEYALVEDYNGGTYCFNLSESADSVPYSSAKKPVDEIKVSAAPCPPSSTHYSYRIAGEKFQLTAWCWDKFDERYIYWTQPPASDIKSFSVGRDGTAHISFFDFSSAMYVMYLIKPDGTATQISSESYSSIVALSAL